MSKGHISKRVAHDTQGRPYAKLSEVKPGDTLVPDGGFDCMKMGMPHHVWRESANDGERLYIICNGHDGLGDKHYLAGQASDGEHLVGLYQADDY